MSIRVVGISDVSIGYGSPEVPALMHSICNALGAKGLLIEPDEISRPPVELGWEPAFELRRIPSRFTDHTPAWHRQFQAAVLSELERNRPDLLIVFGASVFSSLLGLSYWPKRVVYHAYEFISGLDQHDLDAHSCLLNRVDLMIAPEIERLIHDTERVGSHPRRVAAIYNVADVSFPSPILRRSPDDRNGRFLWYGTLNRKQALADHFFLSEVRNFGFDLFGRITEQDSEELLRQIGGTPNLRYFGVVPPEVLNRARSESQYSLVWWNPEIGPNAYYLPSNRFFTSIQAGVPPICGPHPQCVDIIERYGCGLIMPDWSAPSFIRTLALAKRIAAGSSYRELVANCQRASECELNWDSQFARVWPAINAVMMDKAA